MVNVAQSAANCRITHTHMNRTHSLNTRYISTVTTTSFFVYLWGTLLAGGFLFSFLEIDQEKAMRLMIIKVNGCSSVPFFLFSSFFGGGGGGVLGLFVGYSIGRRLQLPLLLPGD